MNLKYAVDLRLTNYKAGITRNGEDLRVLSRDLKIFIEINKYICLVVRSKVPCMQSKKQSMRGQIWTPPHFQETKNNISDRFWYQSN